MDANSLQAEITRHNFDEDPTTVIFPLLTMEHRRICATGPYPFTQKTATWTESVGTAGNPLVGAPADIRAVRFLGCPELVRYGGNLTYLDRVLIAKYYGRNSYLLADDPIHYYIWKDQLYVWPYITTARIFSLDYHCDGSTIAAGVTEANITLPPEYHPLLIDRVCARLSRSEGDFDDAGGFEARANTAVQELMDAYDINMDAPDPMLPDTSWDDDIYF